MIGSGLKKFAQDNGMKVASGVAYGAFRGFAATFADGADMKRIAFSTSFADPAQKDGFLAAVSQVNMEKEYRVSQFAVNERTIIVVFRDTVGTMKKIEAFMDWFVPLLETYGAAHGNVCSECGYAADSGKWVLVDGIAHYMHDACAQKLSNELQEEYQKNAEEDTGSYGRGLVGALVGAALGAVVWAAVLLMGYVASIVGLLIGWLADKGYDLLKGKQGKGKVVILIVAIILGVVLGTFAADGFTLVQMIGAGELPGIAYGDIPALIVELLVLDAEYAGGVAKNVLMGLLFAGLGVFALLRKTGKSVSKSKITYLP